jgi:hypothetical protein
VKEEKQVSPQVLSDEYLVRTTTLRTTRVWNITFDMLLHWQKMFSKINKSTPKVLWAEQIKRYC